MLGGAVGNLVDRFARAYVVDFIHFQIPNVFNFAVFNVADSAITVGVIVIAFCLYQLRAVALVIRGQAMTSRRQAGV